MAKKSIIAREKLRERIVRYKRATRDKLKKIIRSVMSSDDEMMDAQDRLQKMPRRSVGVRVRRRCRTCGRPRGVYRKFGLCRIHLREALMRGDVAGGRKSSW